MACSPSTTLPRRQALHVRERTPEDGPYTAVDRAFRREGVKHSGAAFTGSNPAEGAAGSSR
jgi:hypothetical protein